ncbi:MAG: hypothetical protein ABJA82_01290 [Myxococcales bacterium]
MAGYSGTPLPQKLGIKPNARLAVVRAPDDFARTLGALRPGVTPLLLPKATSPTSAKEFDVIVCFVRALADVERDVVALKKRLHPAGGLWFAWPKKIKGKIRAAVVDSDVTENELRARGLASGLVDNKVCAIDEIWSGLRFVVRLADRPTAAAKSPRR